MKFFGLQKLTLLDYPGKVACTIFTGGCNFRCPFCHNASLVLRPGECKSFSEEEILSFLKKRVGVLEGVCITGGEPLMQNGIDEFISKVKELGYNIKLDTNGSFPDKLKNIIDRGLVDRVAMDIKNSKEKYSSTVDIEDYDITPIQRSIDILLEGKIDYEFRTTVSQQLHTTEDMVEIGKWINGAKEYYIQNFKDSGDIISGSFDAVSKSIINDFVDAVSPHVQLVSVRES
ncbi:MAG: anaerobic ribonucleoside-triphosphate reductase activating protein [Clostridia bacterium]|nr:anaerobic ribonucleoside-triphosphate reductase activating protein [Clostridia bacterium]